MTSKKTLGNLVLSAIAGAGLIAGCSSEKPQLILRGWEDRSGCFIVTKNKGVRKLPKQMYDKFLYGKTRFLENEKIARVWKDETGYHLSQNNKIKKITQEEYKKLYEEAEKWKIK